MIQSNFIIGIVEIIEKKEYRKDTGGNICVITDDDDIMLRFLVVFGG